QPERPQSIDQLVAVRRRFGQQEQQARAREVFRLATLASATVRRFDWLEHGQLLHVWSNSSGTRCLEPLLTVFQCITVCLPLRWRRRTWPNQDACRSMRVHGCAARRIYSREGMTVSSSARFGIV